MVAVSLGTFVVVSDLLNIPWPIHSYSMVTQRSIYYGGPHWSDGPLLICTPVLQQVPAIPSGGYYGRYHDG